MRTEDYKVGDRVRSQWNHSKYGTIMENGKDGVLRVKWDNEAYNHFYAPENGLSIELALPYIREEKLNQLGIW